MADLSIEQINPNRVADGLPGVFRRFQNEPHRGRPCPEGIIPEKRRRGTRPPPPSAGATAMRHGRPRNFAESHLAPTLQTRNTPCEENDNGPRHALPAQDPGDGTPHVRHGHLRFAETSAFVTIAAIAPAPGTVGLRPAAIAILLQGHAATLASFIAVYQKSSFPFHLEATDLWGNRLRIGAARETAGILGAPVVRSPARPKERTRCRSASRRRIPSRTAGRANGGVP